MQISANDCGLAMVVVFPEAEDGESRSSVSKNGSKKNEDILATNQDRGHSEEAGCNWQYDVLENLKASTPRREGVAWVEEEEEWEEEEEEEEEEKGATEDT
ncbi:hypothetical protein GE21DRAFT_1331680 [Neurospora crassa]|nr:hypothetical protein GE21DRAFT_1331680 [Neurospora crassa]